MDVSFCKHFKLKNNFYGLKRKFNSLIKKEKREAEIGMAESVDA